MRHFCLAPVPRWWCFTLMVKPQVESVCVCVCVCVQSTHFAAALSVGLNCVAASCFKEAVTHCVYISSYFVNFFSVCTFERRFVLVCQGSAI
uniref:Putative secreted protein n=1 Tax=Amblyomma cajennense TaxID=34607 RepID=A0A023FDL4_AMBCJ